MKIRRNLGLAAAAAVMFVAFACEAPAPTDVRLQDLIRNPASYKGRDVRTEGWPEYAGTRSYVIPYIYTTYNPFFKMPMTSISYSEVELTTHNLHTEPSAGSEFFPITEREGGMFLPGVPYVPASGELYKQKIRVRGNVVEDKQGFHMEVDKAEEVE